MIRPLQTRQGQIGFAIPLTYSSSNALASLFVGAGFGSGCGLTTGESSNSSYSSKCFERPRTDPAFVDADGAPKSPSGMSTKDWMSILQGRQMGLLLLPVV